MAVLEGVVQLVVQPLRILFVAVMAVFTVVLTAVSLLCSNVYSFVYFLFVGPVVAVVQAWVYGALLPARLGLYVAGVPFPADAAARARLLRHTWFAVSVATELVLSAVAAGVGVGVGVGLVVYATRRWLRVPPAGEAKPVVEVMPAGVEVKVVREAVSLASSDWDTTRPTSAETEGAGGVAGSTAGSTAGSRTTSANTSANTSTITSVAASTAK